MMDRKQLETASTNVFIQKNIADGLSFTETKKRATALMDGNMDAQLRRYIKKYGRTSSKQIKPDNIVDGHSGTPKKAKPNTVIDHKTSENQVDIRSFYGSDGYKKKDIHTTDHGNPKQHPFGTHGEYAEDYEWDNDGRLKNKTRRELTEIDGEENSDIL